MQTYGSTKVINAATVADAADSQLFLPLVFKLEATALPKAFSAKLPGNDPTA